MLRHCFAFVCLASALPSGVVRAEDPVVVESQQGFRFTPGITASSYPETGYDQPLRPQFHFSSRRGWLNDPNGMVFDGKKYHLFFQHNPLGTEWGNMTWGHATSLDMVRWTQRDHALLPYEIDDRRGTIFSGTAVVDHNNSLGKQVGDVKTLVAFYTFASDPLFGQSMAYSTDLGDSWQYWNDGRPVVENQGLDRGERDPKVFWHDASQQWIMVLWVQERPGRVRIFQSSNLVDWTFGSDLMRDWAFECMDVVFLPLDGDASNIKCVFYDASFDYEVGTFDGTTFHSETDARVVGGGDFYAAQSFSNAPDGRVVQIGWMRGGPNAAALYGLPYNQQMSFPCELSLRSTGDGPRVFVNPIAEIASLVAEEKVLKDIVLSGSTDVIGEWEPLDLADVEIEVEVGSARQIVFDFPGVRSTYDAKAQTLEHIGVDDQGRPRTVVAMTDLAPRDGVIKLRFLVDRQSIETFAFDGERFRADYYSPANGPKTQSIRAIDGEAKIRRLVVRRLKSAW